MTFGFVLICGWNTIALWYCKYGLWLTKDVVYFSIAESWTFEEMFFSSSSSALVELCAHWINIYCCIVWLMELWSCSPGQILDGLLSPFCQVGRQLPVAHNELSPHSLPLALHTNTHSAPHTLSPILPPGLNFNPDTGSSWTVGGQPGCELCSVSRPFGFFVMSELSLTTYDWASSYKSHLDWPSKMSIQKFSTVHI